VAGLGLAKTFIANKLPKPEAAARETIDQLLTAEGWIVCDTKDASLDVFWLRDESLSDSDNLPEPGV